MADVAAGDGGAGDATVLVGAVEMPRDEYDALVAEANARTMAFARDEVERLKGAVDKAEAALVAARDALAESEARLAAMGG